VKNIELEGKNCRLYKHLDLIAKRWVIFILLYFSKFPKEELRYFEIKDDLPGITPKILSNRLSLLVKEKILKKREEHIDKKKESYYSLTPLGKRLLPIIKLLQKWGEQQGCCIAKDHCDRCKFL
jgi:DNA-binding HxlR family transcriptional regulator